MDVEISIATQEVDFAHWDQFVLGCPTSSFFVTSSWLRSYEAFGMSSAYIMVRRNNAIIAGAAIARVALGPLSWIQIPHGPSVDPNHTDVLHILMDAIEEYANQEKAMFIQVSPFEASVFTEEWEKHAELAGLVYDPSLPGNTRVGITEALVKRGFQPKAASRLLSSPVEGQIVRLDVDDLIMSFRKGTRRDIRYTLEDTNLLVRRVDDIVDLKTAYEILADNAARQRYPLRPWESFEIPIWNGIQKRTNDVFIAYYDRQPQAVVVIAYGGGRAAYAMGGTKRSTNNRLFPAHLLQYYAMQQAIHRGFDEYDLTAIVEGGIADFKRGFRPLYYRLSGHFTRVYQPRAFSLYQSVYPILMKNRRQIAKLIMHLRRVSLRGLR